MSKAIYRKTDGATATRPPRVRMMPTATGEEEVARSINQSSYETDHPNPARGGGWRMSRGSCGAKRPRKLGKESISIGTWNVRTLYQTGKTELLKHELTRYSCDILGLAELRWTGQGESQDGTIIFSGHETNHEAGVAILMSPAAKLALLEYRPVSECMIMARFNGQPFNITVIQVYAPTKESDDATIDLFYTQLQQCMSQIKSQDIVICMGDWNAKIGSNRDGWENVMGKFGYGTNNGRGHRLLQFASLHNLYVTNTKFKHKASRKWTWESPNGRDKNMIDFILVSKRWMSSISGCRSFPGADIASDHNLVICNAKLRFKKLARRQNKIRKFDLERLKLDSGAYKQMIRTVTMNIKLENDVNKALDQINTVINDAAAKEVGLMSRRNKAWITNETLALADEKREARKTRGRSDLDRRVYNDLVRRTRESAKKDKEEWIEERCTEIQQSFDQAKTKKAYDLKKKIKKKYEPRTSCIKDKVGQLLTEKKDVVKRWAEYCQELYSDNGQHDIQVIGELREISPPPVLEEDDDILLEEVEKAVKDLKNNKASGVDGIPAELTKAGGESLVAMFHELCQKIWRSTVIPAEWTKSLLILIPKKGDLKKCENYRTISLINHSSKILLSILLQR